MLSVRPAYPRRFYAFGVFVAVVLLLVNAVRPAVPDGDVPAPPFKAFPPHTLAMELTR